MPYLIVQFKGGREQRVELNKSPTVLGRSASCDLQVIDEKVSRKHCQLAEHEGQWYLEDLDSKNHTWIGLEPVSQVILAAGDQFRIGGTHVTFRTDESQPEAPNVDSPASSDDTLPEMSDGFSPPHAGDASLGGAHEIPK